MMRYLADKGHRILRNGYNVIPILPGDKRPSIDGWRLTPTTKTILDGWVSNGRASHGVGITTGDISLFDLDILHRAMNRHMVDYCITHIGFAPERVGNPPRCGLMYRSPKPFKKHKSKAFIDPDGNKAEIEILGIGQQFVAYHEHPDTKKPYVWMSDKQNPEATLASDLTEVTEQDALDAIAHFEKTALAWGWKLLGGSSSNAAKKTTAAPAPAAPVPDWASEMTEEEEDPFDISLGRLGMSVEELRNLVRLIPNNSEVSYEGQGLSWLNIMGAIHHETEGSEEGRAIAREYSDRFERVEEEGKFDKTWNSLGKNNERPVTARVLVKLAKEYRQATIADQLAEAKTKQDLEAVAETISKIAKLTSLEREEYAAAIKEAGTRILGHNMSIKIAREMIRPPRPDDLKDYQLNEDGVALAFAEKYKDTLRFNATTATWHKWDGIYWKPEKTRLAFHWARETCRELRADNPMAEALAKAGAAEAVEKYCRADPRLVVESTVFDTDPLLLGTPEGTIDLRTGELREARQEDYITKLTNIGPGFQGNCPRWMKFLNEVTKGDATLIRYLQMQCGYYLTGSTREQSLLFIHGPGGNGKGVFIHTLEYIFGDYSTTASMDTFADNHGFHRHPADIAALNGFRLVVTSEVAEGQAWDEVRIKALTGGDRISARLMRENFSNFVPNFKIMVIGNNEPSLKTVDDAMKRRLQMALFDFKPPVKNLDLESELKAEGDEILSWMVEGALDYHKNGMIIPETVREETDRYFSEQDALGEWLDGYTEKGDNYVTATTDLKASYDLITGSEGFRSKQSAMAFSAGLAKRGYERVSSVYDSNGHKCRGFKGLRLREAFDEDQPL
jgi:P4 family phage/plasmid primase-like protien